jgi:hypothetical protein
MVARDDRREYSLGGRTLQYLEVADLARVPVVLSPAKHSLFDSLVRDLNRAAARSLTKKLEELAGAGFQEELRRRFSQLGIVRAEPRVPPLEAFILRIARRENLSLVDATLELRGRREAREFQKWVWRLHENLASDTPADQARAAADLKEFSAMAEEWGRTLDVLEGVSYTRHPVRLEAAPTIGWLFKLLGPISVRDPILYNRKRYVGFVSQWFRDC